LHRYLGIRRDDARLAHDFAVLLVGDERLCVGGIGRDSAAIALRRLRFRFHGARLRRTRGYILAVAAPRAAYAVARRTQRDRALGRGLAGRRRRCTIALLRRRLRLRTARALRCGRRGAS
jgi:hypothetical protein